MFGRYGSNDCPRYQEPIWRWYQFTVWRVSFLTRQLSWIPRSSPPCVSHSRVPLSQAQGMSQRMCSQKFDPLDVWSDTSWGCFIHLIASWKSSVIPTLVGAIICQNSLISLITRILNSHCLCLLCNLALAKLCVCVPVCREHENK